MDFTKPDPFEILININRNIDPRVGKPLDFLVGVLTSSTLDMVNYSEDDLSAILSVIEIADLVHKGEIRKSDQSPYITHPLEVAIGVSILGMQYPAIAAGSLHDTVEALMRIDPSRTKEMCLDYVILEMDRKLKIRGLGKYLRHSEDVREMVGALTRNRGDSYPKYLGQLFELDEINLLRVLIIKSIDRAENTNDTFGYSAKKKLLSVFKTLFVANQAKSYMAQRVWTKTRARYRTRDFIAFYREHEDEIALGNIGDFFGQYWERRMDQVNTRNFLFSCLNEALWDLGGNTYPVLDNITSKVIGRTYEERESEGRGLRKRLFRKVVEREKYFARGGFQGMTSADSGDDFDGIIQTYIDYLNNPELFEQSEFTQQRIYRDAIAFKKLLTMLLAEPNYFLKGLEWQELA